MQYSRANEKVRWAQGLQTSVRRQKSSSRVSSGVDCSGLAARQNIRLQASLFSSTAYKLDSRTVRARHIITPLACPNDRRSGTGACF